MATADSGIPAAEDTDGRRPVVDVVVPVLNEERVLETSVHRLHRYLRTSMPFAWRITIVDNGSTDRTYEVARDLAARLDRIRVLRLDRRGRGLALRTAWQTSDADVVAYMDVDLSTGLEALLPLVAPLVSGHSDIAIGSRLAAGASVARGPKREAISRIYNLMLRTLFAARFHDAQCGFKALRADVAMSLLPAIADNKWFFDTELLLLAEHNGLRIHEVPVDWVDDPDSRVDILRTATDDLKGLARMAWRFARGGGRIEGSAPSRAAIGDDMGRQLVTFASIGAVSTAASIAIFLTTRGSVGAVAANALALTATAAANTWANRRLGPARIGERRSGPRFVSARSSPKQRHCACLVASSDRPPSSAYPLGSLTFARRGRRGRGRDYWRGAVVYAGGVAASTTALIAVDRAGAGPGLEVAALAVTWSLTTVTRFSLLRRPQRVSSTSAAESRVDAEAAVC